MVNGKTMTFLLADDDTRSRESVKRFISRNIPGQHTFLESSDGAAAVSLYEREPVDWVLMDIEMKPMNGLEALRAIMRAHSDAKVVIVTFYGDAHYRTAAMEAGARAFVVKDRLEVLQTVLAGRKTRDTSHNDEP